MSDRNKIFKELSSNIKGEVLLDTTSILIYATDASAYREFPEAVVYPKDADDIRQVILFARKHKMSIIPRAAGTSLAGQVVGKGIVVDISKYMKSILQVNKDEHWVTVQPGVVLDELNIYLKDFGLFFGPETSTSNRCNIGGMVGNNACGAHSLIYGSTRDHLISVKGFLSDGSEVEFKPLSNEDFKQKCQGTTLENKLYQHVHQLLGDDAIRQQIADGYPEKELKRRNTGYAIDLLSDNKPFNPNGENFNFSRLIAGSEGTLVFITEVKLNLVPLPPKAKGLICAHFETLEEALQANLIALKYQPGAIELIDDIILNCTKDNIEQRKNRFFISGEPGAILVIEFARESMDEIESIKVKLEAEMHVANLGFHFPLITGADINKVWALRKAALGLLSNIPGDAKPVSLVEDTAVTAERLPEYIADFKQMLKKYNLTSVFHAHAATGELHLRPVLNLKVKDDLVKFRKVAEEVAYLIKKHRGSLSGEHGDGRLRGEFIPIIIGQENYKLCQELKKVWDPDKIFNPGKITETPPMDKFLRIEAQPKENIKTYFDFSDSQGFMRHVERCNGSGDCRKTEIIGGTMCPSFMASRDERTTTRARANALREFIVNNKDKNPFNSKELYDILDLCLSCKACKAECPSNVDMAKLKAEFLQHYYDTNGASLRSTLIAYMPKFYKLGSMAPGIYNFFMTNSFTSGVTKRIIGFATERSFPRLHKKTVKQWAKKNLVRLNSSMDKSKKHVKLFVDEFTNYLDAEIGIKTIELLTRLGFHVSILNIEESGRTYLSKGFVKQAQKIINKNLQTISTEWKGEEIIGIEPSAILSFRDEYLDLSSRENRNFAISVAEKTLTIEEFLHRELKAGWIESESFTEDPIQIALHGHCYQKTLSTTQPIIDILQIPKNTKVTEIKSGCCGMAGSFGYEKEHYHLSLKVGELVLFPAIRKLSKDSFVVAAGTSCRQQINDNTGREVYHPVEILHKLLR